MARIGYKQCDECGNNEHFDIEGFGEDEGGNFTDYICEECGQILRIYDNEQ
jgi:uncharacterized Zn finger protein